MASPPTSTERNGDAGKEREAGAGDEREDDGERHLGGRVLQVAVVSNNGACNTSTNMSYSVS